MGHELRTCDKCEPLNAFEVCVFDRHDASVSEELFWVVVDELSARKTS